MQCKIKTQSNTWNIDTLEDSNIVQTFIVIMEREGFRKKENERIMHSYSAPTFKTYVRTDPCLLVGGSGEGVGIWVKREKGEEREERENVGDNIREKEGNVSS